MTFSLILFCINVYLANCDILDPGPSVKATRGEIWPKPFYQKKFNKFSIVRSTQFKFKIQNERCDILIEAIKRYEHIIELMLKKKLAGGQNSEPNQDEYPLPSHSNHKHSVKYLDEIIINLTKTCENKPHPKMVEEYQLRVGDSSAYLESDTIWGILRGLESFSQLLFPTSDGTGLQIGHTEIYDRPRYSFRGLMVDTSRHFINIFTLKQILNGMAYNKLNVFHWHIVDDQSFPYESVTFPELSAQGAYDSHMTYSQSEIKDIIEYARLRGIRTLAEFNTPGHTRSWGISHPEILTACAGCYNGKLGPIDPTKEESYTFMEKLLAEVITVFPDEYIHLGGDAVDYRCWESSRAIEDYLRTNNQTFEDLERLYNQRIVEMVNDMSYKSIVWQEVFQNGNQLANETVVHVWKGNWRKRLQKITKQGLSAILSCGWYLDYLSTGEDWRKFYMHEPSNFPGDERQQSLLIGGEACIWSEYVDSSNIVQHIFPRVSATAEKLWSQKDIADLHDASERIEEHTCRMKCRGLPAQPPNGPGYCSC